MGCVYSRGSPALISSLCCLNLNNNFQSWWSLTYVRLLPWPDLPQSDFWRSITVKNRRGKLFFCCCCCYCIFLPLLWCFAESLNFCSGLFEMHEELVHKHERNPRSFTVEKFWFIAYYLSAKPFQLLLWKISAYFLVGLRSITQAERTF